MTDESPDVLNLQYRYSIAQEWALAARDIAQETKLPQALKVWDFLNDSTTIGVPIRGGSIRYFFHEKPERSIEQYAFLTPILKQDAERLDKDDFRYPYTQGQDAPFVAQFREGSQAIYFPEGALTARGKGVIMLHEATHAINEISKRYDRADPATHWLEEADVYTFEFDLLSALGKEPYEQLVNEVVNQFSTELNGRRITPGPISDYVANNLWRQIFGGDITDKECGIWTMVCRLDSFWRYFQANIDNPRQELADYIQKTVGRPQ